MTNNGYLSVVDRKKDMIKTGGENVASREVEEALYEIDESRSVAVFGIAIRGGSKQSLRGRARPHRSDRGSRCMPMPGPHSPASSVPSTSSSPTPCPRTPAARFLKRTLREQYCDLASGA